MVDDRDLAGQPVGLVQVLRGQQHRRALGDQLPDHRPHLAPAARVQAGGRLVQEQHRGPLDQARGQVEPAPHATGIGLDRTPGGVGQVEPLQQLTRPPLRLRPGHLQQPPDQQQVLKTSQILIDRRVLAGQPDQLATRSACGRYPRRRPGRNRHRAAATWPASGPRWFPRPVRPQQAQHHARPDSQINAVHRQRLPEPLDQAHRLNRERHGMRSSGPGSHSLPNLPAGGISPRYTRRSARLPTAFG